MGDPYDSSQGRVVVLRRRTPEEFSTYILARVVELERRVRDLEKRLAEKEGGRGK